jgi:hypothetical protein
MAAPFGTALLIVTLLASASGGEDRPENRDRNDDGRSAVLLGKLAKPVKLGFRDAPLGDVLKSIKRATAEPGDNGVAVHVDPRGLIAAKVTLQKRITFESDERKPLGVSLGRLLRPIGLTYRAEGGLLKITAMSPKMNLIDRGEQTRAILVVLEQPLHLALEKVSLEDALIFITMTTSGPAIPSGLPIHVDPVGLQEAGLTMQAPVSIRSKDKEPLKSSLRRGLRSVKLDLMVKDGLLTITSQESYDEDLDQAKPGEPGPPETKKNGGK